MGPGLATRPARHAEHLSWQVANDALTHKRGMPGDPSATIARLLELFALMKIETVNG